MAVVDLTFGLVIFTSYLPGILIFMLEPDYQEDLLKFVTKWFCIILGVSLFAFLLSKIIDLPHNVFKLENNDSYLPFENYYFFLQNNGMYDLTSTGGALRFGSVFLEPGHMAMVSALLLFANKYNLTRQPLLWIPLVCIALSFSLVGVVIVVVSLGLLKIHNLSSMIITVGLVVAGWFFVTVVWNGGENPANKMIVERLEFDENKGIRGNNRTSKKTDFFFRQCLKDGTYVTGVGIKKMGEKVRGAGYKIFILKYGIIGLAFVAALYLLFIPKGANTRYAASFFLIIVLLFLQRAYPTWYSWLFCYIIGIGSTRGKQLFLKEPNEELNEENDYKY